MENVRLDIDEYTACGLGDIYCGLISFIQRYAIQNHNSFEGVYNYSIIMKTMKASLKILLDYLKTADTVFIPSLNRNIDLKTLNQEEQLALEARCKEYLLQNLNAVMNQSLEQKNEIYKAR